jgi:predicted metal-dependent hydrolase
MSIDRPRASTLLECSIPADLLRSEVRAWASRVGVEPKEVHVRTMTRKWASCSSNGRITLSDDLLREPAAFRAEVIVHELLHLKVPNHGPVFRSLLRAHLAPRQADGDRG